MQHAEYTEYCTAEDQQDGDNRGWRMAIIGDGVLGLIEDFPHDSYCTSTRCADARVSRHAEEDIDKKAAARRSIHPILCGYASDFSTKGA